MSVLIREISTPSGRYKAAIEQRDDATFEVTVSMHREEIVPGYGKVGEPFWERKSRMRIFVDTLEHAEKIADEELGNISGETLR